MYDYSKIIDRMVTAAGSENVAQMLEFCGFSSGAAGAWKRRGNVPDGSIAIAATRTGTSFEWLKTGEGEMRVISLGDVGANDCGDILAQIKKLKNLNNDEELEQLLGVPHKDLYDPERQGAIFTTIWKWMAREGIDFNLIRGKEMPADNDTLYVLIELIEEHLLVLDVQLTPAEKARAIVSLYTIFTKEKLTLGQETCSLTLELSEILGPMLAKEKTVSNTRFTEQRHLLDIWEQASDFAKKHALSMLEESAQESREIEGGGSSSADRNSA